MIDRENRPLLAVEQAGREFLALVPKTANRHGLIAGATGTGKTVTLQSMAETFSDLGVPVFAADVKGDLSGPAEAGGNAESVRRRVREWGLEERGFSFRSYPVQFWDVFGSAGVPVRATVAGMGPLLLGRLLDLNETQTAVLHMVFAVAADEGLELADLKDLRRALEYVSGNAPRYASAYGNITAASAGAVQRGLMLLASQGAEAFFGEPALNVEDFIRTEDGRGILNILAADRLIRAPKLYAVFLVWLLTRLFEVLPETGDPDKPKLVFFFDEAHLLFNDAPRALLEKVEQVVRLIRSKGVGVYFVSQSPSDLPDAVLGQLGNRVQHALRAFTPRDQKAVRAAAGTFRANPAFSVERALTELGTGEALVSLLDEKGMPRPVERAFILPPQGRIGPIDPAERESLFKGSLLYRVYGRREERVTAFERLEGAETAKERATREKIEAEAAKEEAKHRAAQEKEEQRAGERQRRFWGGMAKSVLAPLARSVLRSLFRGGRG
ncbi:MAG: DUF853 domain-containing protein [Desulfovibrio sp.]|jgi:DNA helicase HerA-like ATPase|nr:DUF853 domain-containing protein [Desulfovibrio sp.]